MRGVFTRLPELEDPSRYPNSDWGQQRMNYWEYWQHFDGTFLDEKVGEVDKYPLKLNIYNMACMLHAGFLFGEVQDGNDPLVSTVIEPWGLESSEAERTLGKELSEFVERVWYENEGRSLQQEGGLITQILGGVVYNVSYDPSLEDDGRLPIRVDLIMPEYFFPVWRPTQYWNLLEAIVAFEVSQLQAKEIYGVEVGLDSPLYQEMWSRNNFEITVDSEVVTWGGVKQTGKPIGGMVPYTYIPHVRAGEFYGISLLKGKQQLAEEVNARYADLGDIIGDSARNTLPAVSNSMQPSVLRLGHGVTLMDLGNTMPGQDAPKIHYPASIQATSASTQYASDLLSTARVEAYTPPICYGLDEGSQRSALTLALRMIPLVVHIRQERTLWTTGLSQVARQILTIAAEKDLIPIDLKGIRKFRIWQEWAPILPRGREQLVNEMIVRLNAGLISPDSALTRLADTHDMESEMNLIREWLEYQAEIGLLGKSPFSGTGSMGEQAGMSRPKPPSTPTVGDND